MSDDSVDVDFAAFGTERRRRRAQVDGEVGSVGGDGQRLVGVNVGLKIRRPSRTMFNLSFIEPERISFILNPVSVGSWMFL